MYALTDTMDDTEDLTDFTHLWVEDQIIRAVNKFKRQILDLGPMIEKSHQNYLIPYKYLDPKKYVKARIDT